MLTTPILGCCLIMHDIRQKSIPVGSYVYMYNLPEQDYHDLHVYPPTFLTSTQYVPQL